MHYKWGIFIADLSPILGSEQGGKRPVLVISDEDFNGVMPVVTILPITTRKKGRKVYPNECLLNAGTGGILMDSIILTHQIRTISKERLASPIGLITRNGIQESINDTLRIHLNL